MKKKRKKYTKKKRSKKIPVKKIKKTNNNKGKKTQKRKKSAKKKSTTKSKHSINKNDDYYVVKDLTNLFNGRFFDVLLKYVTAKEKINKYYRVQIVTSLQNPNIFIVIGYWYSDRDAPDCSLAFFSKFDQAYKNFVFRYNRKMQWTYKQIDIPITEVIIPGVKKLNSSNMVMNNFLTNSY